MLHFPGNVDFLNNPTVAHALDGADSFGRMRAVSPYVMFASNLDYGSDDLLWNSDTATGGTGTYDSTKKSYNLAVTTSNGSKALRESKARGYCQPGRTCVGILTAMLASGQSNTSQRIGAFSDNNGLFWELSGTSLRVVSRTKVSGAVVDTPVAQASFNIDPLDGTGTSGVTLDVTKIQQWVVEWSHMGSGIARFGVIVQGRVVWAHYIDKNNSATDVWMQTGNLPLRCEIINTAAAAGAKTLVMAGCALLSDGQPSDYGRNFSVNTGNTYKLMDDVPTQMKPLIILRLKSTVEFAQMTLRSLFAFAASNGGDCLLTRIILNPTIAGGTAEAYNAVSSDSAFEYDVACTGSVTGGTVLGSYLSKTHQENQVDLMRDFGGQPQIFKNFAGTSDKLCIAAGYHNGYGAGGDPYCYATFNWKELDG